MHRSAEIHWRHLDRAKPPTWVFILRVRKVLGLVGLTKPETGRLVNPPPSQEPCTFPFFFSFFFPAYPPVAKVREQRRGRECARPLLHRSFRPWLREGGGGEGERERRAPVNSQDHE